MSPVYLVAGAMFCKCSTVDIDISAGWLVYSVGMKSAVLNMEVSSV